MKNGQLPASVGWIAYKLQLWSSITYTIGTMTNNLEEAEEVLEYLDYEMLNVLGSTRTVKKGRRRISALSQIS
jgi:hypothetical protein